ncbi:MAG TPA: PAS domain S-box protein [Fimbriimonas sp.]|nr:PAS domain S-box protein [Fimbriimonas sp.]
MSEPNSRWEEAGEVLSAAFDRAPAPSWVVDLDELSFLEVNGAAVERYGYSRETFLASELTLIRPNDDLETLATDYNKFAQSPTEWFDRRHRNVHGEWINVSVRIQPIGFGGRRAGLVWMRDNSLRKEFEERFVDSLLRFNAILDASLDAVVTIDKESNLTGWSRSAEQIFGWTRDEVLGKPMQNLIMPERFRQRHLQGLASYVVTGRSTILGTVLQLPVVRRDGEEFQAQIRIERVPGRKIEFVAYIRDLTERREGDSNP